ncbi:MAG: DUF167 domain-containing protein [Candidatus Adiutrix sp.]|jgi:uncharacterized protein (TIGR00251 family)|nr:DUF167 domain-containing protein [Candidatus Adiutrix sp.]
MAEPVSRLGVTLSPRAKNDALVGPHDGGVKIKIAAPPAGGAANAALIRFLAEILALPQAALSLAAGQTGRRKIIRVAGLTEEEMWLRLNRRLRRNGE